MSNPISINGVATTATTPEATNAQDGVITVATESTETPENVTTATTTEATDAQDDGSTVTTPGTTDPLDEGGMATTGTGDTQGELATDAQNGVTTAKTGATEVPDAVSTATTGNGDTEGEVAAEGAKRRGRKIGWKKRKVDGDITLERAKELFAKEEEGIAECNGMEFRSRIKRGRFLAAVEEHFDTSGRSQEVFKAWVQEVCKISWTNASNALRLRRLVEDTYKADFARLAKGYRNKLSYCLVEQALFAEESVKNLRKKACNLDCLRFDPSGIKIKFKDSDDESDITTYSVRDLKKLLHPSTKSPQGGKSRPTVATLTAALQKAEEENAALRSQIAELVELLRNHGNTPLAPVVGDAEPTIEAVDMERLDDVVDETTEGVVPPEGVAEASTNEPDSDDPDHVLADEPNTDDPDQDLADEPDLGEPGLDLAEESDLGDPDFGRNEEPDLNDADFLLDVEEAFGYLAEFDSDGGVS